MENATPLQVPRRLRLLPGPVTAQAALAGLLLTMGMPPVRLAGLVAPVALALLLGALCQSRTPGRTAWWFGLAHQTSLLHWLFFLDPSKSIPSRALVPVQAGAAILYVSVFYLGLGWVFGRLQGQRRLPAALWLWPVLWTAMEALRGVGELGFPWCLGGAAFVRTPLLPLVRTSGELGLGFAAALSSAAVVGIADWIKGQATRPQTVLLAGGTILWWGYLVLGAVQWDPEHPDPPRSLRIVAVQPDVALADKWVRARLDSTRIPLRALTERAGEQGAQLIVWPETAVPAYLRFDQELMSWTRSVVRTGGAHLLAGFPDGERTVEGKVRTYNSSGLFAPHGELLDQYAKHHLLPIGEAMPFTSWLPFLAKVNVGQAEWSPGGPPQPIRAGTDPPLDFSVLICFESIFSSLARESVLRGSRCLMVITNDGWFGDTVGPLQHAWLAVLRAVECGVPLVRSANNGVSFICDERGRIQVWLPVGRRDLAAADVVPGRGGTPYLRWGNWPLVGFGLAWLVTGFLVRRNRGKPT